MPYAQRPNGRRWYRALRSVDGSHGSISPPQRRGLHALRICGLFWAHIVRVSTHLDPLGSACSIPGACSRRGSSEYASSAASTEQLIWPSHTAAAAASLSTGSSHACARMCRVQVELHNEPTLAAGDNLCLPHASNPYSQVRACVQCAAIYWRPRSRTTNTPCCLLAEGCI